MQGGFLLCIIPSSNQQLPSDNMKQALLKLRTRLKLKQITKQIIKEIEWNFGYDPNSPDFSLLLDKRHDLLEIAKENFPDVYKTYESLLY